MKLTELVEEESGRSAPRRIFSRLFGGGSSNAALPARSESGTATTPADSEFISGKMTGAESMSEKM